MQRQRCSDNRPFILNFRCMGFAHQVATTFVTHLSPAMRLDLDFILQLFSQGIALFLSGYVVLLLVLRQSRYFRINECPKCRGHLSRHKRSSRDKWVMRLSFGILPVKRYRCYSCYWEGQTFDIPEKRVHKKDRATKDPNPTS